jgi:poly-gamma-glutamate synthesis protein (capsule biosynthesis protein)
MASVKLIAVGDICLQTKNNENPFQKVKESFKDKDILFGNLETVLSARGQEARKAVLLHTMPEKAAYLKDAAFDVLNVANNHIMDLGPEGFNETVELLGRNNLSFIGASNSKFDRPYTIIKKKGTNFGFLGYDSHGFRDLKNGIFINKIDENAITAHINELKLKCDVLVVSLHWGIENVFYPSPDQVRLARKLIDAGAVLVLGHHPHVVQGIERYKGGLIAYSLGNFQFFQTNREITRNSVILAVEINKGRIEGHHITTARIDDNFIPAIMNGEERDKMLSFIETISMPIINEEISEKWWFEEIAYEHLHGNMKAWIIRIRRYGIRHLLQCIRWLISPFIIKCYLGLLRRKLRKY